LPGCPRWNNDELDLTVRSFTAGDFEVVRPAGAEFINVPFGERRSSPKHNSE
jgi:hypothetical protein